MSTLIQANSITSSNLSRKRLGILFFLLLLFAFLGIYLYLRNFKQKSKSTLPIPTNSEKDKAPSTKKPELLAPLPHPLPTPQAPLPKKSIEPDSKARPTNTTDRKVEKNLNHSSKKISQLEKDVIRYHFVKELINYFGFKGSFTFYDSVVGWEKIFERSSSALARASIEIKVNNKFFACKIDIYAKPPLEIKKVYQGSIINCVDELAPLLADLQTYPLYKNKRLVGHFKFDILHGTDRTNHKNKYFDLIPRVERDSLPLSKETLNKIRDIKSQMNFFLFGQQAYGFTGYVNLSHPKALDWKKAVNIYYKSELEIKVNNKFFTCNLFLGASNPPLLLTEKEYEISISDCNSVLATLLKYSHIYPLYKNGELIGHFKFNLKPDEKYTKDSPLYHLVPP